MAVVTAGLWYGACELVYYLVSLFIVDPNAEEDAEEVDMTYIIESIRDHVENNLLEEIEETPKEEVVIVPANIEDVEEEETISL